ncbi:Pectin degradation repressor protein KdgR [Microbacterium sp. 8M]|uniref:IclR family transcriptional regulator domain-containing protein n=1 Tax=Microbacterium sp. 8M TaxID=2653153 RepID=UPI0012F2EC34|nr:IclR family transcriptional regulator C-terminal domain-containing protein [Microbacterium sp. 8M]VXB49990.1 Pectin degradation repressor protein KdgR [Microbacterium sp. 8M]
MSAPSSLSQGLALLGSAVARERTGRPGFTASRLADATGIERSRVSRLTQELRGLRFLQRDEDAVFSAGDAYFRVAASLDAPWLRAARHELRMLAAELGTTALVSAADGAAALLLRTEAGVGASDGGVRHGMATPIWCTGAGRALLWEHSAEQLQEVLHDVQFVGVGGPAAARTIAEVHALMERDRAAGVVTAADEYAEGVTDLALPILGRGGVVASIAVSGPPRSATRTRAALMALHGARDRLSALAGAQ